MKLTILKVMLQVDLNQISILKNRLHHEKITHTSISTINNVLQ